MGWLFTPGASRRDLIHRLTSDSVARTGEVHSKTIRYCLRGNNLWALTELCRGPYAGTKFIMLYMLRKDSQVEGWGYKDIEESCGPYYLSCPKSYIKQASAPINKYSADWRKAVLQE